MFTVTQERLGQIIALSLLAGAGLGAVYDLFRFFRIMRYSGKNGTVKSGKLPAVILIFFEDILFWIICSIVTIIFVFVVNSGNVRFAALGAEVVGFAVWYFTLGRITAAMSRAFAAFLRKLSAAAYKYLILPAAKAVYKFGKTICRFIVHMFALLRFSLKVRGMKNYTVKECKKYRSAAAAGFCKIGKV